MKIKKITVAISNTSVRDVKKTSLDEQVGGEEITVADIEDRSYSTDEDTTLSEDSFELENADHHESTAKREVQLRSNRRFSTPASLMYTDSHSKGSVHVNVIAEVNEDAEKLSVTSDSCIAV